MSDEPKYTHHSLNVHPSEKAIAGEVSAETGIDIAFKALLLSAPRTTNNPADDMVGVYCKTDSDAARFERAFERRRWENSKNPQGE